MSSQGRAASTAEAERRLPPGEFRPLTQAALVLVQAGEPAGFNFLGDRFAALDPLDIHSVLATLSDNLDKAPPEFSSRVLAKLCAPDLLLQLPWEDPEVEHSLAKLAAGEVVSGDLVLLSPGHRVPADLRLVETTALRVDESNLTGESAPVAKEAEAQLPADAELGDRRTMAYAGTLVTAGKGRGVVVATGRATELGRIAQLAREAREPRTPLQQSMRELSGWLVWVALGFSVLVPNIGLDPVIERVRILDVAGKAYGGHVRSRGVPTVRVHSPAPGSRLRGQVRVAWQVSDPDTAPSQISAYVAYSPDGGRSFVPLGVRLASRELAFDACAVEPPRAPPGEPRSATPCRSSTIRCSSCWTTSTSSERGRSPWTSSG